MSPRQFTVAGVTGVYLFVGQCLYTGDDGLSIEHDWMRLSPVGGGDEIWVDPADVTPIGDAIPFAVSA